MVVAVRLHLRKALLLLLQRLLQHVYRSFILFGGEETHADAVVQHGVFRTQFQRLREVFERQLIPLELVVSLRTVGPELGIAVVRCKCLVKVRLALGELAKFCVATPQSVVNTRVDVLRVFRYCSKGY